MRSQITARLWKRRRPSGPWTAATVAELRRLSSAATRSKGWTLTEEDTTILLRRMQEHSPHHEAGPWAFMWGDPQLSLFKVKSLRTRELAPLHRAIPGGRRRLAAQ